MMLALSITRLRKGRDIQGEVGTNPHMQRLGLECPARPKRGHDCGDCTLCTNNS